MSQKTSTNYPIEALNINNPKFEENRKKNFEFFKAKSKLKALMTFLTIDLDNQISKTNSKIILEIN